jgi:hypothetical protein
VFGWSIRIRGNGERGFDDTTAAVSGTWVLGLPPSAEPGILPYIMGDSVEATLIKMSSVGGRLATL